MRLVEAAAGGGVVGDVRELRADWEGKGACTWSRGPGGNLQHPCLASLTVHLRASSQHAFFLLISRLTSRRPAESERKAGDLKSMQPPQTKLVFRDREKPMTRGRW